MSPVDKNGNNLGGGSGLVQAASVGNGITFFSQAILPGAEGAYSSPIYLGSRAAGDWTTRNLLPPASTGVFGQTLGWSEDQSKSFVANKRGASGFPFTIYARENATGELSEVATGFKQGPIFATAPGDGSTFVFESRTKLAGTNGTENKFNVYAWNAATGQVRLASVLNDGAPPTTKGSFVGPYQWWASFSPTTGGANAGYFSAAEHAVSADGSHLFFTSGSEEPGAGTQIYLRKNPTEEQSAMSGEECTEPGKACTFEVSASERETPDPNGDMPAAFIGASEDGSSAFFTSPGALTDDATTGSADTGNDLYRYRPELPAGDRLTDLAPDPTAENGVEVKGVLGISPDGSYVYFLAAGALPGTGAPTSTCAGSGAVIEGLCNLYVWHEDPDTHLAEVSFVAQLDGQEDSRNWQPTAKGLSGNVPDPTARVLDSGDLLLVSVRNLTGYDSEGSTELYRYRPGSSAELGCVSCSPLGTAPVGGATLTSLLPVISLAVHPSFITRNVSADGNRVFFESPDKLVPGDNNGEGGCPTVVVAQQPYPGCQDVYQWEAEGTGSCASTADNGGCLSLISTGTGSQPAFFADNDESGDDVFFFTGQQLVGQDKDELIDVYDARLNGGIAAQSPPEKVYCEGEACKGPVLAPAPAGSPGSATFNGPGNPKPKKHHKKKHHKKKHHKKKHHQKKHHQKKAGHK